MSDNRLDDYVDVAERIGLFYEKYPDGRLGCDFRIEEIGGATFLVATAYAYTTPEDPRPGVGTAQELIPGRTAFTRGSEYQNAETSAWGRAIASLGIATKRGIATKQEVASAQQRRHEMDMPTKPVERVSHSDQTIPEEDPWQTPKVEGATTVGFLPGHIDGPLRRTMVKNLQDPASDKQKGFVRKLITELAAELDREPLEVMNAYLEDLNMGTVASSEDLTKGQASALIEMIKEGKS